MTGMKVAQALASAKQERGNLPENITVDNGSEFCGRALEAWAMTNEVQLRFIRPGRPVENGLLRQPFCYRAFLLALCSSRFEKPYRFFCLSMASFNLSDDGFILTTNDSFIASCLAWQISSSS
jgi:hypothetical protein